MSNVNNEDKLHVKILKQYIKDLSYENFQKNDLQNKDIEGNETSVDINVIYKHYDKDFFGVIIKIVLTCMSKKEKTMVFNLELDYFGLFKADNRDTFNKDDLSSEGAKIIFPFARSIIANITQNGGNIPIYLDNLDFKLLKP
jgi:preprotein translocase subunit SecB